MQGNFQAIYRYLREVKSVILKKGSDQMLWLRILEHKYDYTKYLYMY